MKLTYRLHMMESERGWGQDHWHEDYTTAEEAQARMDSVNSKNTSLVAPDYYIQAERIEVIKEN